MTLSLVVVVVAFFVKVNDLFFSLLSLNKPTIFYGKSNVFFFMYQFRSNIVEKNLRVLWKTILPCMLQWVSYRSLELWYVVIVITKLYADC